MTLCSELQQSHEMDYQNGTHFAMNFIAILTVTSPIVINVPTRGLLAVETKDSFVLWLAKFKYQKTCL